MLSLLSLAPLHLCVHLTTDISVADLTVPYYSVYFVMQRSMSLGYHNVCRIDSLFGEYIWIGVGRGYELVTFIRCFIDQVNKL